MIVYEPGDSRLLQQTKIWVDKHGEVHDLETMNIHHRAGLIGFLRRRATWYWHAHFLDLLTRPEMGDDFLGQSNPQAWMECTPLMRRLVELDQRTPVQKLATRLRNRAYPLRKRLGMAK